MNYTISLHSRRTHFLFSAELSWIDYICSVEFIFRCTFFSHSVSLFKCNLCCCFFSMLLLWSIRFIVCRLCHYILLILKPFFLWLFLILDAARHTVSTNFEALCSWLRCTLTFNFFFLLFSSFIYEFDWISRNFKALKWIWFLHSLVCSMIHSLGHVDE